jgi:hypothetical protein
VWLAAATWVPLPLAGQPARAGIILLNGRTAQISRPVLEQQSNPGMTPARYRPSDALTFSGRPPGSRDKDLRWAEVWRIDYYPVDGGANCAAILTFNNATKLGVRGQVVFDMSDEAITRQLPRGTISALQSARWHSEYKPLTAPAGQYHLEPYGTARYPKVWDILQCASFDSSATAARQHIRTVVFTAR